MTVPDYQGLMPTVLQVLDQGLALSAQEIRNAVADQLKLSEDDRAAALESGRQTRLANRVSWACFYMARAGLLARPVRGKYVITPRGKAAASEQSKLVNNKYLNQFPEFRDWINRSRSSEGEAALIVDLSESLAEDTSTPIEKIKSAHAQWRQTLATDLLESVLAASPRFFEKLVVDVLLAMGYGGGRRESAQVTGRSGDGGIDGIINEDRLGLSKVLVQAKRWKLDRRISRPELQQFGGALDRRKGIFITTASFTKDARDYADGKDIVLVNGEQLARLMIDYGVGVSVEETIKLMRLDEDYFSEE
jgi:restriction system protein